MAAVRRPSISPKRLRRTPFLRFTKQLRTLRDPNRFSAWLHAIVRNCCLACLRKTQHPIQSVFIPCLKRRWKAFPITNIIKDQREDIANEKRHEVVQHLLNKLSENEQTVITLHYLGNMRCEEIGKFLDVPLNSD